MFARKTFLVERTVDFGSVILASALAYYLRVESFALPLDYQIVTFIGLLLTQFWGDHLGMYRLKAGQDYLDLVNNLLLAWLASFASLFALLIFAKQAEDLSRQWLMSWFFLSFGMAALVRLFIYYAVRQLHKSGRYMRNVFLIGRRSSASAAREMRTGDAGDCGGLPGDLDRAFSPQEQP